MIVVSASMKKAGSGWYFNLTNDLLVAAGHADARAIREQFGLHKALQGGNCQVNKSHPLQTARVFLPHLLGHTFAVKTHGRPLRAVRQLMALGVMRATYIYRDPRDVVLSVLDHGRDLRERGQHAADLSALHSVEDAARYVRYLLGIWEAWDACPGVLTVRYEDLVADPSRQLQRLASFLRLRVAADDLAAIVERYDAGAQSGAVRRNLHYNKGVTRRFERAMDRGDRARCDAAFAPYLARMGYAA